MALVLLDKVGGEDDPTKLKLLEPVSLGLRQQRNALAAGLSSGVDQLQGLGYSIAGGAADLVGADTARDWANEQARRNQIDAALAGRPDLENIEDQTLGSALPYMGYQIVKQVPIMAGITGAQFIPGAGQAATALGLTRLGALAPRFLGGAGLEAGASIAARRAALAQGETLATGTMAGSALGFGSMYGESVEGGDPNAWKALALSPIYGAAEAVLPAVLHGGLRLPSRYSGNLATRMAKAGGVAGSGEALTELGQNELEMGMRSDLTDQEKASRRLNSAAAGFLVGGGLGTVGGLKGAPSVPTGINTQQVDLMSGESQVTRPAGSQFKTADQMVGLQTFINQNTGVDRQARKNYEAQFKAAYDEPSGQFVTDPATGIERQLSIGEYQRMQGAALDLTQDNPAAAAAANAAAIKIQRDPKDIFIRDTLKVIPNQYSRQLFDTIAESGIDPQSDLMVPVWNYAAQKYMGKGRYEKAVQLMDEAIIKARKGAPSGTPISTGLGAAGSVGVGGAVVPGAVGATGSVSPVTGAVGGTTSTAGAPLQQTGVVSGTSGQPSTVVDQGPTTRGAPGTTALVDTSDDAWEIARATGNAAEIEAMREDEAGGRADQLAFGNTEMEAVIGQYLAKSKNKERDRKILQAYILARKSVPEGYKGNVAQEVGDTFGIDASRVRQIGNPELLANIAEGMGFDRNQVFTHLGIDSATKSATTELGKLESDLAKLEAKATPSKADIAKMSELSEKIDQVKGNIESGDLTSALKTLGVEGEAGEMFATLDDSREWQKASTAGSQMAVKLVGIADKIAELKAAAAELKQLGLAKAEAAATERINALTADYQALTASITAPKAERKQAKSEKKTEDEQKAAEEKAAALKAEAEKLSAEAAAKRAVDRKGLAVGDTVVNTKLGTGVVKSFSGDGDATLVTVDFKSGQTKELSVKMAKLEKTNAVQVQGTAVVPVQPKTEAGKGVGGQVRRAKKPTAESQAPTEILSDSEQAAQAWDKVASSYPTAPKFADLTKTQQQNFIDFGPDNWTTNDVNIELTKLAKSGLKFGKDRVASKPYTAEELTAEIKDFVRADIPDRKLMIVDSIDDLLNSGTPEVRELGEAIQAKGAYGVTQRGVAYLVADRIQKGQGRAKFMHEVGAHLGLENLLPTAVYDKLVDQLEKWAESGKDSLEAQLAAKAKARVGYAKTPTVDEREELLAYFVEEAMLAGVDPTAMAKESGPLMAWFRTLWAAFKVAVRRLGFKPENLSAQDVVNLAFGAARLEMNGSWHGTAATFRRFSHAFMNSGEGAQAYGWGTYLAQAVGIGKKYWEADVERKIVDTVDILGMYSNGGLTSAQASRTYVGAEGLPIDLGLGGGLPQIRQSKLYVPGAVRRFGKRTFEYLAVDEIFNQDGSPRFSQKQEQAMVDYVKRNFYKPEGSLMRLDTAVPTSEMIDWDASFANQPKVVTDFIKKEAPNIKALRDQGVNIQITSGAGIVKYLTARFYKEGGYKGSWKDADPAIKMAVKEQASKYLEANGIQGIQFYDATSREVTLDNVSFTKNGKTVKGRDGVLQAYFTPGAIVQGYGGPDKVIKFDPVKELITVIAVDNLGNPRRGERERTHFTMPSILEVATAMQQRGYDLGASNRTRNLVIFNEKNIFRIGSEVAADKERMKFGFAGTEATGAKTFERRVELVQAQLDTANGIDPETIWKETGWYKGTDNKWRFEFDDSQAKFKQDFKDIPSFEQFKLSDVLDHPELFKQYPELNDVTFEKRKVMMDVWGSVQGWFDPKTKKLVVTPYAIDPLSTVLHEVQHWIQSKEKFENGSSPQGSDLSNKAALTKLRNELQLAIDKYDLSEEQNKTKKERGERSTNNFGLYVEMARAKDIMIAVDALLPESDKLAPMYSKVRVLDSEVTRLETAKGILEKKFKEENKKVNVIKRVANYAEQMKEIRFYSDKIKTTSDEHYAANKELKVRVVELTGGKDVAHELYRLVAGEAEARNVQSRMGMSFEERVKSFPAATMDVSPENTLTSTGRGGAYLSQERMKFGKNAPNQGVIQRNITKLPKAAQQPARLSLGAIGDAVNKGLDYVVFTSDLVDRATKSGVSSAKKFVDLVGKSKSEARENEIAVEKISDMYALVPEKDRGTGDRSVNRFLFDSTREGKWGYGKYRNDDMGARFDALAPESRAYVEAVFAHGSDMLAKKKKLVLDSTNSEYDAMIAAAKADGDTANEVKLTKEKEATLKRFQTLFKIRDGIPYAPIKRNGSHVVIAKSKEYLAAEAANDTKKITELESNSDHYHVSFTDGKWEARTLQQDLNDQGFFDDVQIAERDTVIDEMFSGHSALRELTKMRSRVDAQAKVGDKSSSKMLSLISQMYLEALAEGSARKSEMRRRGVAGEVDMIRSFAQQGRADANFMASIKYNPQVQDALQEMRNQVKKGDRERKSEIFNELAKRYVQSLDYSPRPWLNKLTRMSSLYYLATSPAYYLQNLTQPWMMSVPAMAGKHDYIKVSSELFKAYAQLGGVMKSAKLLKQQFDFGQVPSDVRDAIKELVNRGKIDIGLDTEMGEFKVEGDGYFAGKISAADKALRLAVQKVESVNRLSTAMAAYRLELVNNKGDKQAAIDYADRILTETHGDYTSFNAPRAFNTGVGKVALQFRKFQLIQLSFYAKLIKDALQGADRAAALKTLSYSFGHTALLAGAMGLPGYAAISWAIGALFGSDDEPYDLTREIRKAIGDEDIANLVLRGAPTLAGVDISGKVGAGNMLSIMPFSQADLSTTAGRAEAFGTLIGGASLGMASRMIDGLGLMMSGDWYRGIEQTMPKGVSDAMKAYRIANEGMTRRNGDIILPPDEVSAMDALFQAIGVQPVKQTVAYERQTDMKETTQNFTERTTKIKNDYVKAAREGNTEAQGKAREAWTNLQAAKQRNGVKSSPLSELMRAPAEQAKRERMTVGGVQYKANTRQLAEELAGN